MIVCKAPLRMSFVGGGSDLPSFYRTSEGAVLSSAINKFVYVAVKNRFEPGIRVSYSATENVSRVDDIEHPLVRNALKMLRLNRDLEIISMADIPSSGTGLGSSSSFSVALIKALLAYQGRLVTTSELAELACQLEIDLCKSPIGKQDQYAAAFGGLRVYRFHSDDSVTEEPICVEPKINEAFVDQIIAFYVGGARDANLILKEQSAQMSNRDKLACTKRMVELVWILKHELESGSFHTFGDVLHENWKLKRSLTSGISNSHVDEIYENAMACGALGGKLLGAGGGGFMIFHVPTTAVRLRVKKRLQKLREVELRPVPMGSSVVLNGE